MRPHTRTGRRSSIQVTWTGSGHFFIIVAFGVRLIRESGGCRWDRIARLLFNPGDTLLVEEWTYVSAMATARPINLHWQAVPMAKECAQMV